MVVDGCSTSSGWVDIPEEDDVEVIGVGGAAATLMLVGRLSMGRMDDGFMGGVVVAVEGGATNRLVVSALRLTPKECCC